MKRFLQITGILVGLLFIVGVVVYAFTPREKLLTYVVPEINNIRVTDVYLTNQKATMKVQFDATSKIVPVFIYRLKYDFRLYGQSITFGEQNLKQNSQTGKIQRITLPVSLQFKQTGNLVQQQIARQDSVEARFQVHCNLPLLGRRTFNVTRKLPIVLPVLSAPRITAVKTEDIGFRHQRLILTLAITNPNNFDFYLRDLKVNVQLKTYLAAAGSLPKDLRVKAQQVTSLSLPSATAIERVPADSLNQTSNLSGPYTLKANLVAEPVSEAVGIIRLNTTISDTIQSPKTK
ncbi:hypothetical protein AHMF7605_21175 [Adhaeribacter arboris]|uniref:Late embryogenesis abundant protein LEA-2 subgroup domain-containing protein n=1 Tax=Adhaeribacter arboris TaxID=2072846 RepID=A0A2T2YJZ4_9BACT|nr:LEA type 2 family protein [Adhaeribacter arboris]PSR55831.1 hypothetical protein AHMF7605_21175 [Adhaeribacter arboris]